MTHLDKPWPGDPEITQKFGARPLTSDAEPPGYVWPDGSVSYYQAGGTRHDHVHCGIDLALAEGTQLTAPSYGIVEFAGQDTTGFGLCLKLRHSPLEIGTLYGHLESIHVAVGQAVMSGESIAKTNNTGNSSGPHLHFSVYRLGDHHWVDPMPYLQAPAPIPTPPTNERTVGGITFVEFVVHSKPAGATRLFDGPCTLLKQLGGQRPNTPLQCDAFMHGEPRMDYDTRKLDPLWFHLTAGGWVPSAHTIGYPPGVKE